MNIRKAIKADSAVLRRLLEQLGYPDITEAQVLSKIDAHATGDYRLLVAENENKVIGFIALHWFELLHWEGPMGRISSFCVDEQIRGKGVGMLLLDAAENILFDNGCVKIEVTTNLRRASTHQFYSNRGYAEDSRRFVKYQEKK